MILENINNNVGELVVDGGSAQGFWQVKKYGTHANEAVRNGMKNEELEYYGSFVIQSNGGKNNDYDKIDASGPADGGKNNDYDKIDASGPDILLPNKREGGRLIKGSVRMLAVVCGIIGLKPSFGHIPHSGTLIGINVVQADLQAEVVGEVPIPSDAADGYLFNKSPWKFANPGAIDEVFLHLIILSAAILVRMVPFSEGNRVSQVPRESTFTLEPVIRHMVELGASAVNLVDGERPADVLDFWAFVDACSFSHNSYRFSGDSDIYFGLTIMWEDLETVVVEGRRYYRRR
ncbi:fatty acid amide hydrolase-like protein [Tanacetum coccineum]